jgi:hypothetical protein
VEALVDLKTFLQKQSLKLMQDPRVMKLMQDPRVMNAMMKGLEMRGKVQQSFDEQVDKIAQSLNLATKKEVRELKRTLRKMEQELAKAKGSAGAGKSTTV